MLRPLKIFIAGGGLMLLVYGAHSAAQTPSDASPAGSAPGPPQSAAADYERSVASLRNEIAELRRKVEKPPKDVWDKISSLSGFASGVAVALIGFYATNIYNRRQRAAEEHRKEQASDLELARFGFQKELEAVRFGYEQTKWREALSSDVASKLLETRLAEYSCLWSRVEVVARSQLASGELTQSLARELATHVKNWRYSTGGLLAEPTTRDAAYAFQQALWNYDETGESYRRIRAARRILRDALRADLGVSEDMFGKSLISVAAERLRTRSDLTNLERGLGIEPNPDR
jgi:hypothetical protein